MSRIIINTDKKKFFLKVDEVEDKDFNGCDSKCIDKIIKITITDGRTVWESTKGKETRNAFSYSHTI